MKPKRDFLLVLDEVKAVVYCVEPKHLGLPTPDTEWTVRNLLQHMLYELCWVPDVVMGVALEKGGVDCNREVKDADFLTTWHEEAIAAREAVHRCDPDAIVHLSYGDHTARHYLEEAATDQLVHGWDLAQAIGVPLTFDKTLAHEMFERLQPRREELHATGLYARPVHVPAHANYQTKLLALLGRSENWR